MVFYNKRRIEVFDTTLRDGEQAAGISFTNEQKYAIARQLDKIGVDVIEAGTPVVSKEEKECVKHICKEGFSAKICGLARVIREDIDACIDCDVDLIHVFVSASQIQRDYTIEMSEEEVKETSYEMVKYVKDHGFECMYSAMDATRTRVDYLIDVFKYVEEAGADIINIPDTVGVGEPFFIYDLVSKVKNAVKIPISIHCHNDFGLAVANTLAAVRAGASQVQVSVNGIGERAGNADLIETVMSLMAICGYKTNIKTEYLFETSRLIERFSGVKIPVNKPIVGENAFSHESGIHSHGVIRKSETFEPGIITPEMVGHVRRIVLGKHVGRHAVEKKLEEVGISPSPDELAEIVTRVKELGTGKRVTDDDLIKIAEVVMGEIPKREGVIALEELSVMTGNRVTPTASLRAKVRGEEKTAAGIGNGPVDAAIKAIQNIIGKEVKLREFRIEAISGGSDALAEVIVGVEDNEGRTMTARGVREDIVMASVEAYINAINRLMRK
ncbi:MAG: 2-isopropylmalate synthase [Candidatus Syntropharchaeia archaeon]